jgi:hypothetical protein
MRERPITSSKGDGNMDSGLAADYAAFDGKFAALEAAPKLEDRRAMAIELARVRLTGR